MGRSGFGGGRRGFGGGRRGYGGVHHRRAFRRRFVHRGYHHRRLWYHNRRCGYRRRYYGHYWGYNPYYYGVYDDGYTGYSAGPAMTFQTQNVGIKPQVNFRSYNVSVQQEATVVPPAPAPFEVTCPAGCSAGDQVAVFNPHNGQRIVVTIPSEVKEGGKFQVSPPAPRPAPQTGGFVGQKIGVDLDGDGTTDVIGTLTDTDGDGVPDAIAVDINNDGIIDQYVPYTAPGGQKANLRVTQNGNQIQVTIPANIAVTLKMIVDAIETNIQSALEKRTENQPNVEDVDFTTQFVQIGAHQWINGKYQSIPFVPKTVTIQVPPNAQPGQVLQVTPPPGYDPANKPFPVQLPPNIMAGSSLNVVLPALEAEGAELPVAEEAGTTPLTVQQKQVADAGWDIPAAVGTLEQVLASGNYQMQLRGVETIAFENQDVVVASGASRTSCIVTVIVVLIIVAIIVVSSVVTTRNSLSNGALDANPHTGYECTFPADSPGTPFCWDSMSWSQLQAYGYDDEWSSLGWTASSWAVNSASGTASELYWSQLTLLQESPASFLGFTSLNWNSGGVAILT